MRGEFVDLHGARLYYYAAGTRGAGSPVVFVHGFATSGHLWSDVVSLMPAGHRLIVLDALGHGRSDPPGERSLTLRAHGERIVELLDVLGVDTACVVGHGVGGAIAQSLAIHSPRRVERLALLASTGFGDWATRDLMLARATLPLTRRLPPPWLLSMVRTEFERGYDDRSRAVHSIDRFLRPFATLDGRDTLVRHLRALDTRETASLGARLGEIDCPTTIVWGRADGLVKPLHLEQWKTTLPHARYVELADVGHFPQLEAPAEVAAVL